MEKKQRTKKNLIIMSIVAIIILVVAAFLCVKSIKSKEEYILHYNDNSILDYNVYLKKNDYYTTPFLPKDRVYVSTLIDYIDANFNYNFDVYEDISLGYKYYINAKLLVEDTSGKKILESDDILLEYKEIQQVKDKNFFINENVKIDYNKYNQIASSFLDKYDISAKAYVLVSMYVDVSGIYEKFEKELNDSAVVSLEIPLAANTTEVKMKYDLKNNVNEKFEYGNTSIVKPTMFIIALIIAVLDIIWLIYEIVLYVTSKDVKVLYQELLKKIFRDYGPYITKKSMTIKTKDIMYTISLRVEFVDTFDDLINVRDSLEKPILYYESVPGEQSVFYIIDTKVSYIYILNASDLGKKKKTKLTKDFVVSDTDEDYNILEETKELTLDNHDEFVEIKEVDNENLKKTKKDDKVVVKKTKKNSTKDDGSKTKKNSTSKSKTTKAKVSKKSSDKGKESKEVKKTSRKKATAKDGE